MGMEIKEHIGEGFAKLVFYQGWRVAMIHYADHFDQKNIKRYERHMETDEVFVLLKGEATLIVDGEEYKMEPEKLYNIKAGTWHAIYMSKDASVLIVENADTSPDNSEYQEI